MMFMFEGACDQRIHSGGYKPATATPSAATPHAASRRRLRASHSALLHMSTTNKTASGITWTHNVYTCWITRLLERPSREEL